MLPEDLRGEERVADTVAAAVGRTGGGGAAPADDDGGSCRCGRGLVLLGVGVSALVGLGEEAGRTVTT